MPKLHTVPMPTCHNHWNYETCHRQKISKASNGPEKIHCAVHLFHKSTATTIPHRTVPQQKESCAMRLAAELEITILQLPSVPHARVTWAHWPLRRQANGVSRKMPVLPLFHDLHSGTRRLLISGSATSHGTGPLRKKRFPERTCFLGDVWLSTRCFYSAPLPYHTARTARTAVFDAIAIRMRILMKLGKQSSQTPTPYPHKSQRLWQFERRDLAYK